MRHTCRIASNSQVAGKRVPRDLSPTEVDGHSESDLGKLCEGGGFVRVVTLRVSGRSESGVR